MEFTLDFPLIRDIVNQEHARVRDEIRDLGVLRALESSQQRHDARIAAAADVGTLACSGPVPHFGPNSDPRLDAQFIIFIDRHHEHPKVVTEGFHRG